MEETDEKSSKNETQATPGLFHETTFIHVLVTKEAEPAHIPLSTNLGLKYKYGCCISLYGELTIDNLIDTGALFSAIREQEADHSAS